MIYYQMRITKMEEEYSISIDLSLLPLPLRNKYISVVKRLKIRFLLENQILKISEKNSELFFIEVNKK